MEFVTLLLIGLVAIELIFLLLNGQQVQGTSQPSVSCILERQFPSSGNAMGYHNDGNTRWYP